jgi:hypothetical protein
MFLKKDTEVLVTHLPCLEMLIGGIRMELRVREFMEQDMLEEIRVELIMLHGMVPTEMVAAAVLDVEILVVEPVVLMLLMVQMDKIGVAILAEQEE